MTNQSQMIKNKSFTNTNTNSTNNLSATKAALMKMIQEKGGNHHPTHSNPNIYSQRNSHVQSYHSGAAHSTEDAIDSKNKPIRNMIKSGSQVLGKAR